MKIPLLLALLAGSSYFYFQNPASTPVQAMVTARPGGNAAVPAVTVAAGPSSYDRWKTGPNAQTDLKTGPNAQTDFQPFAPSEQATWNQASSCTIVSGGNVHRVASGRGLRLR